MELYSKYNESEVLTKATVNLNVAFISLFSLAFILRILIGYNFVGYETDLSLFKYWGAKANEVGFYNLYSSDIFIDYPPGYIYILAFLDKIRVAFSIDYYSNLYNLIMKMPSILCDMVSGFLIYKLAKTNFCKGNSILLSCAYLFCPAVILNSSTWGQIDSVTATLLLASIMCLYKEKVLPASIIYGLGLITKPQMLIFAPIYLFYVIFKKDIKGLLIGLGAGFATVFLVATPFINNFNYLWLFELYTETMNYYEYYTINAYNFWGLIGFNWKFLPDNQVLLFFLTVIPPLVATGLCGILMYLSKNKYKLFVAPVILMATVFMFSIKMHERYLFPVLIFLLLTYVLSKNKGYLFLFTAFGVTHYLNCKYILNLDSSVFENISVTMVAISVTHFLLYVYLLKLTAEVFILNKKSTNTSSKKTKEKTLANKNKFSAKNLINVFSVPSLQTGERKIKSLDILLMVIVTVAYGIVAFWNLGANETANTSWEPSYGESTVLKVDGEFDSIMYLSGISVTVNDTGTYRSSKVGVNATISYSTDGINWGEETLLQESSVYSWTLTEAYTPHQYVKITATADNSVINEIAFKNSTTGEYVNVEVVEGDGYALIDEQDVVPEYSTSYNSTYFDEIYHARTAYEYLIDVEPYENTHPTLGKLIMALGITIFGMNPFGWRFMGTLFGVLMLPILYHILKKLFGSTFLATCGALLFAFDFMHYTQTRIATIDTYAVFFILLMYCAMLYFLEKDILHTPIKKLLIPLGFSGLFMGIGFACKWTVAYSAIGLAVLLFGKFIVTYLQNKKEAELFKKRFFTICGWCMLLFVAIPFGVYFCAFLPITTLDHNVDHLWWCFCNYQTHMYNYHANLVATHSFSSPWYEWPLVIKPIWYYVSYAVDGIGSVSSISCLGNPLLWWTGILGIVIAFRNFFKKPSLVFTIIAVGFTASYLPWILISRLTFIYHYFTAVPFLIMAVVYLLSLLMKYGTKGKIIISAFVAVNLLLFVIYYPAISGSPTTADYLNGLELFSTWYFI